MDVIPDVSLIATNKFEWSYVNKPLYDASDENVHKINTTIGAYDGFLWTPGSMKRVPQGRQQGFWRSEKWLEVSFVI